MQCNSVAARAVLLDFHLFSMLTLISCTDVVFFTTLRALKSDVVSRHVLIPPDFYRKQYNINGFKIQEFAEMLFLCFFYGYCTFLREKMK